MSPLWALLRLPRTREAVHPPTPQRESCVANVPGCLPGLGFSPLRAPRTGPPTSRSALPGPCSHIFGVHSSWPPQPPNPPHRSLPRSSPSSPFLPTPLPASLWLAQHWPQPRSPGGGFWRKDISGRGTLTECQLRSLHLAEPRLPRRRRTRSRPDRQTRPLPPARAAPPRCSPRSSGEPGWHSTAGRGGPFLGVQGGAPRQLAPFFSVNGPLSAPLLLQVPPAPRSPELGWKLCRS